MGVDQAAVLVRRVRERPLRRWRRLVPMSRVVMILLPRMLVRLRVMRGMLVCTGSTTGMLVRIIRSAGVLLGVRIRRATTGMRIVRRRGRRVVVDGRQVQ